MTKIAGSGSASGSNSQRHGSADPDPDPDLHQNVMDPQHCQHGTISVTDVYSYSYYVWFSELPTPVRQNDLSHGCLMLILDYRWFSELPDTSFTRSISNPEAVMRRRRQQKLEKKLQQFRSKV
jgi:hypothetical protein